MAQLNLDPPVDSTPKFSEAWKTSALEWGVLYSLLRLLGVGVGEGQIYRNSLNFRLVHFCEKNIRVKNVV